jgi:hypothetical protein
MSRVRQQPSQLPEIEAADGANNAESVHAIRIASHQQSAEALRVPSTEAGSYQA